MIRFMAFASARLAVGAFCLMTAAYAALNCSPFAFDMFIRPQLFPWVTEFVAWHHFWCCGAFVASTLTLVADLDWRIPRDGTRKAAHWLAVGYVGFFGAVAGVLVVSPYLPRLWNDSRALPTAIAAFVPLLWLAAIDHLSAPSPRRQHDAGTFRVTGQHRLLVSCAIAAGYLWAAHVVRALWQSGRSAGAIAWALTIIWALALTATVSALVYTILFLKTAVAARTRTPERWERGLTSVLTAAGICEFLRRLVLPTVSLNASDAAWVATVAGVSLASMWSGLACRRPAADPQKAATSSERLLVSMPGGPATVAALLMLPLASFWALGFMEQLDWAFVVQRLILVCEGLLAYTLVRRATRHHVADRPWSARATVVPAVVALATLFAVPHAALRLAAWTGDRTLEPAAAFERYAAADPLFKFMSDGLVTRAGFDGEYFRFLQVYTNARGASITIPDVDLTTAPARPAGHRPDIFLFVIDSLRRDYLSPYNPAVSFTPNIERFASENFVFRNVFTRHGATQLAAPSIWAGAEVIRKILAPGFERMNAVEKLVNAEGYRIAINDHTVAAYLRPTTPVTKIDPNVLSVDTDLCQNLKALEEHLDASTADARPVFGYLSPMNIHILNTRRGGQQSLDGDYPGFYAPYASRLRRIDACFGNFVSYLQQRGRYDNSIIVLTSDHGDSLGENGYWGHATWLFPEVARLPLIVRLPPSLRAAVTTDLAGVAFSADIAPTLWVLCARQLKDLGPLFGSPLFVPKDGRLPDRRRDSFLLTSSYGAAYGLLRRNGRQLYVTDLVERREFAYDLSHEPTAVPDVIAPEVRRVNQRSIRDHVTKAAAFYRFTR